jgi:hypothetical protein
MSKKKASFEQSDIIDVRTDDGDYENAKHFTVDGENYFETKTENIMFSWSIKGFGFGTTTFYYEDGKLKCDNEAMNKDSIKKILCEFVDRAEFQS